jgi:hypothetical protein
MNRYQVHYEYVAKGMVWVQRSYRIIRARNEAEAVIKCKSVVTNSFGHWVNRQATEPMALY